MFANRIIIFDEGSGAERSPDHKMIGPMANLCTQKKNILTQTHRKSDVIQMTIGLSLTFEKS